MKITIDFGGGGYGSSGTAHISPALKEFMEDQANRLEFGRALARSVSGKIILRDSVASENWKRIVKRLEEEKKEHLWVRIKDWIKGEQQ